MQECLEHQLGRIYDGYRGQQLKIAESPGSQHKGLTTSSPDLKPDSPSEPDQPHRVHRYVSNAEAQQSSLVPPGMTIEKTGNSC